MKIVVGNVVIDPKDVPVAVALSQQDIDNISAMGEARLYCEYDQQRHKPEDIQRWLDSMKGGLDKNPNLVKVKPEMKGQIIKPSREAFKSISNAVQRGGGRNE